MVTVCREAVDQLAAAGIKCTLIDAYSFPLNVEPILAAAGQTQDRILVVEDNYVGGFAAAVAEVAARHRAAAVEALVCRRIPKSAKTPEEMLAYLGLSVADIVSRAKAIAG